MLSRMKAKSASSLKCNFFCIALALVFFAFSTGTTWTPGCDFVWRLNESRCVLAGYDPYAVAFNGVETPDYCSLFNPEDGKRLVNGYTPWTYLWTMPLSFLSDELANTLFILMNLVAYVVLIVFAAKYAKEKSLSRFDTMGVMGFSVFLGASLPRVLQVSNFGLLMAAALTGMAYCLNRRRDVLAGVLYAVLCIKPQIALPFLIPLLWRRRFRTVATAGALCFLSSLPPAVWCRRNPLAMILHVADSGSRSIRTWSRSTALVPAPVFKLLSEWIPENAVLLLSTLTALTVCVLLTRRLRKAEEDACVWLVPAVFAALNGPYGHLHDRVMLSLPLVVLSAQRFAVSVERSGAADCSSLVSPSRRSRLLTWGLVLFAAEFVLMPFLGTVYVDTSEAAFTAVSAYDWFLCVVSYLQIVFLFVWTRICGSQAISVETGRVANA